MRRDFKAKRAEDYADAVRRIQSHGITVNGCFILGLDNHTPAIFAQILDYARVADNARVYDDAVVCGEATVGGNAKVIDAEVGHHAEEKLARRELARRATEALEDHARETGVHRADVDWLRQELRERHRESELEAGSAEGRRQARLRMLAAQRQMLIRLRNEDAISDEVLITIERELDLEAIRAGAGEDR